MLPIVDSPSLYSIFFRYADNRYMSSSIFTHRSLSVSPDNVFFLRLFTNGLCNLYSR